MSESNLSSHARAESEAFPLSPGPAVSDPRTAASAPSAAGEILRKIFSFPAMLASLLVGGTFIVERRFVVDPDLWWHIKVGDAILTTHRWPVADPFSFTVSGQPWLAYEWLGEVVLAWAWRHAGYRGLDALLIVLGTAIVLALYAFATLRSGNSKAGFVASAAVFMLAAASFSLRPQMLGYLFLILTLIALERFRQGKPRAMWFLPILMLIWVNAHGSWIIGLGTILVYWISGIAPFRVGDLEAHSWTPAQRRSISLVFLGCLLALPFTPYGVRLAASPVEFAFSLPLNVSQIQEWRPMAFDLSGGKWFLALLVGFILLQVTMQFAWRLEEFVLFLGGMAMACLHMRFLLLFVPFSAPIFAVILSRWAPAYERRKDKFALNAVLMAIVAAIVIGYFPSTAQLQAKVAEQFPVAAVQYLEHHSVPEPMFNSYGFGGYLVWTRAPQHKVFIDGRADVYERGGVFADYLHIANAEPGALTLLRNYQIQSCLVEPDRALETLLSASPDWQRVYSDEQSVLFVRSSVTIPSRSIAANSPLK
ncbi:MAG: hypothetical protein WBF06_06215 [Candidatus Acidiferrales bacterium]